MNDRIRKLNEYMEQQDLDAILITFPKHVHYLTGYMSDPHERFLGLIMPKQEEPFLFVPALDEEAASKASQLRRIYTHTDTDNPYQVLKGYLPSSVKRIGIEKSHMTLQRYEALSETIAAEKFFDVESPFREMRAVKSEAEIASIRKTANIVEEVLKQSLQHVKAGVTEMEIAAEIEYCMKKAGVSPSFTTTILSGEKSAMPHGETGDRKIKNGELLLFDMGVASDGYMSDITRTFAVGHIDDKLKDVYETVLQANLQSIAAIRPNAVIADLDRIARDHIASKGYGPYFTHRLGHGLGIEIHEYPSIHGNNRDVLREGMVFTIEPGIYLPGTGGVRIEDDVLVTADGVEVLTRFPKELTIIGG